MFKGKRVILVGPSVSLKNSNMGTIIDSYDVVCRIKKSYPVDPKDHKDLGTRTDVLVSHLKVSGKGGYKQNNFESYPIQIYNQLKYIYFPFPLVKPFVNFYTGFVKKYGNLIKTSIVLPSDNQIYQMLHSELGYDPTTGLMFIVDVVLRQEVKELCITGITFQTDGFYESYKTPTEDKACVLRTQNIHNSSKELIFFRAFYQKYKNVIRLDEKLFDLISFGENISI